MVRLFGKPRQGVDPGWGKNRSMRGSLLQRTASSDWKATVIKRMHSNGRKACVKKTNIFGSIPKSNFGAFLTSFWT